MSYLNPEQPIDPPEPSAREIAEGEAEHAARREEYLDDWAAGVSDVREWLVDDAERLLRLVLVVVHELPSSLPHLTARAVRELREAYIDYRMESES